MTTRLVFFYVGLAVLTSATSFNAARTPPAYGPSRHETAWLMVLDRQGVTPGEQRDYNTEAYARRPLMLAVTALLRSYLPLSWAQAFSLVKLGTTLAFYLSFHLYLRRFFSEAGALVGALFVAASLPLTFVCNWWELATDIPELITFTLGLWCLHERRSLGFFFVLLIGTLNRDTAGILVVIALFLAAADERNGRWQWVPGLLGWLGGVAFLSWWLHLGTVPTTYTASTRPACSS